MVVTHLLRAAESGRGAALVLRGEAGIGKTALIEHALRNVAGFKILHAAGTEFETVLPFAGLHQLCAPVLDRAAALPAPQRAALEAALGRREGAPRDRLLVGLAALGLFSECGRREPIVCVVDDAQWLDAGTAHALAFAARRIESEPVAMVFSLREPLATNAFTDLPDLWIEGLDDEDARLLLASEIRAPIDRAVRDRIVAEARGNPLALLELPRSAGMLNMAGGYAIPELHGTAGRIEESFLRRMSELPRQTQMLLVVASAEPLGDPVLLWNALDRLGIPSEAADPAESAGLLEVGQRIRFRHPLVRSAAYRATTPSERRLAHRVLAEVTDSDSDPDRRAWHQAQATLGPSERVAAQLERSASRAQDRGGLAAAAAFTERAAELTPDAARRATRTVTAARLAQSAGAFSSAMRLLTAAETGRLDERQRTEARLQRAQIAFQLSRDDVSAGMLLDAAEALDGQRAREAYLEAFGAAMYVGRSSPERMLQVARAVRARPPTHHPERPLDLLLDGMCANVVLGFEHAVPTLKQAVLALCDAERLDADDVRWLGLACTVAMGLLDDHAHVLLADRLLRMSRTSGAMAALPTALNYRSGAHIFAGELTAAAVLVGEAYAIAAATGGAELIYAELAVSAWRGDAGRVGQLLAGRSDALARGEGRSVLSMDYASAVLHNGLGDYERALKASLEMAQYDELGYGASLPSEFVEAAARFGRPSLATPALERLIQISNASGTDWAVGMELRARALLGVDVDCDELFREAIVRLARTRVVVYLGRTHLVYGEWLRRQGRRAEAREQLRVAHQSLSEMGVNAFARRAEHELAATGEHVRRRTPGLMDTLTVQELNIARRAAEGATSKEIAAELYLSPRTIDAHLRSIFRKTGVTSRRQLRSLSLADHANPT